MTSPSTLPISAPLHPYFPEGLQLAGDSFNQNTWNVALLITAFGLGCAVIMGLTFAIMRMPSMSLRVSDQMAILWFVMTGSIHCFFEGYFVYNNARMASMNDFFGQLWKEYALSDSRYMTSDPFLLCIETLTVSLWGPLCLLSAALVVCHSPYRYPTQALVSTGQFYGNLLYFSTSIVEDIYSNKKYYRPEPFYFWVYFVMMNSIWLVIPACCLWVSFNETGKAFRAYNRAEINLCEKKRR